MKSYRNSIGTPSVFGNLRQLLVITRQNLPQI